MVPPVYRIPGECVYPWSRIIFEEIDVEVSLGNGRADAVGITKGRALAIEFAVTHKVSGSRIFEYRELKHAAVEISIPKVNRNIDGVISYILAKGDVNSRWIYNPHIEYDKWRNIKLGYKGYARKPQSLRKKYYAYE
jgi:hypothetical protein